MGNHGPSSSPYHISHSETSQIIDTLINLTASIISPILLRKMIFGLIGLVLLAACSPENRQEVDELNDRAYRFHYINIDSTEYFARKAYSLSANYSAGRSEALNHLAFVSLIRMDYGQARKYIDNASATTNHQVELLVSDVQMMRLCQRESNNKNFYLFKDEAERRVERIHQEYDLLSEREKLRMIYAQSEMHIVASAYYYYVGLIDKARQELLQINEEELARLDTAQYLAYLYNLGTGEMVTGPSLLNRTQQEYENLLQCLFLSDQKGYIYWRANSLQGLSQLLSTAFHLSSFKEHNRATLAILNQSQINDSLLAGNLAQRSLELFASYGDTYQTAGAYRTLADCYRQIGDYHSANYCLKQALTRSKAINQAPALVSSICEQMSLVFSALDNKPQSDFYRNKYLDIQEQTRQDRLLEARAEQLDQSSEQLTFVNLAVIGMIFVTVILLFVFDYLRRRNDKRFSPELLLAPLRKWEEKNNEEIQIITEEHEGIIDRYHQIKSKLARNKIENLEQRAKIELALGIIPFIERINHEAHLLANRQEDEGIDRERRQYIRELVKAINKYNDILTQWIKLRQGTLRLQIETFDLQPLFEIVRRSGMSFRSRGLTLEVIQTQIRLKADRALTLFMINTLIDNARKHTPANGRVTLSAEEDNGYAVISVSDTGEGMDQETIDRLFDTKRGVRDGNASTVESHGYGLLNCQGIINQYRKVSQIFSQCSLTVKSQKGVGSTFKIRLPMGKMLRTVIFLVFSLPSLFGSAQTDITRSAETKVDKIVGRQVIKVSQNDKRTAKDFIRERNRHFNYHLTMADAYADSVYFYNISGKYVKTLVAADSCISHLNRYYLKQRPRGTSILHIYDNSGRTPAELIWLRSNIKTNYNIIIDLRNEIAVAALALHEWDLYRYNNKVYTLLFREHSADKNIEEYVATLQKSENDKSIGMIVLVVLFLLIFPAYYMLYYRHRLLYRAYVERINHINDHLSEDNTTAEKLQAINEDTEKLNKVTGDKAIAALRSVTDSILDTIRNRLELEKGAADKLDMAREELKKIEMDNAKYHVVNSVLDNNLSTIKHETMYFPSRIEQLIDVSKYDHETDKDLEDLVTYYRHLYATLCEQALHSANSLKMEIRQIPLKEIIQPDRISPDDGETIVLGDKTLLQHVFRILDKTAGKEHHPTINVNHLKERRYVNIRLTYPDGVLTEEQARNLFLPTTHILDCLLARQLIRDIGEATHARACGIQTGLHPNIHIDITLSTIYKEHLLTP